MSTQTDTKFTKWATHQDFATKDKRGIGLSGTEAWGEVHAVTTDDSEIYIGFVLEKEHARLIAAAPEFMQEAEHMLAEHDTNARAANFTCCGCRWCDAMRPIVAKAKGQP